MPINIASWNTNSITIRLEQVIDVMNQFELDVLGIQETKVQDNNFPIEILSEAGFHILFNGQKSYNGTAFVSRQPLNVPLHNLPGMNTDYQRRFLQAEYNETLIINCYVPNGKSVGDEKYDYKLNWLSHLVKHLKNVSQTYPSIILMGDFNIAPDDRDVYDADEWRDKILCSQPERDIIAAIKNLGFIDSFRAFNDSPEQFSWWDYREGGFKKNKGHRIDLIFNSAAAQANCSKSIIQTIPRGWERPSDHTPVIATYENI